MKYLTDKIKKDIINHSLSESPNECCGIIYKDSSGYKSKRCDNVAKNKKVNFKISPKDYINITEKGSIEAYYHSHPPEDKIGVFSDTDKRVSEAHGIPLIMYSIENKVFLEHN